MLSMSVDRVSDLLSRFQKDDQSSDTTAFARRLKAAADGLYASDASDKGLRIRLWVRIAEALDLDATLPLSSRRANSVSAGVAYKASAVMAMSAADDNEDLPQTGVQKAWQAVKSLRGRRHQDFAFLVAEEARLVAKGVAEAAVSGDIPEELASALGERVRDHIRSLPPELRDDAMRDALAAGDRAAFTVLATGTAAFSIGMGVNLAGFSAYVLAAQASAFIPFMSGPAVVSTLFMLANPLFSIPAVLGIGYLANNYVNGGQAAKLAAIVSVQLSLRGLSAERGGLAVVLNDFRTATEVGLASLPTAIMAETMSRNAAIAKATGGRLPKALGDLGSAALASDRRGDLLEGVLSKSRGDALEMAAVTALSAGDVLYNAVSIDPMILAAADFSRSEDLGDIFQFGAFAERIGSMSEAAAAGAGNNLRGYVSEQLVAARLAEVGHVVSFPETSNNAGFDLLVDGVPFQVKCLQGVEGLRTHFDKYPDMPVYANAELAEAVIDSGAEWAKLVYYVDGFDREIADLIMTTSMEAGAALGDLNVPYFAMAVSSARNLHRIWHGRMPLSDLPFSVVMDASVKGGLSAVGALSGKALGLLAFGPAGALVLSSVGGIGALVGVGWTREQATRLLSADWLSDLERSTERFRAAVLTAVRAKVAMLNEKKARVPDTVAEINYWVKARFADDIVCLGEVAYDLEAVIPTLSQPAKARACLSAMDAAKVHPLAVETELTGLLEILGSEPSKTTSAGRKVSGAWSSLKSKLPSGRG
ncbi:Putative transmembrane protein [Neorhizobium galegae bv. officinalis]|nr:Putative transmembrane protein [Neorhizobium galegae bv. officinalis]